MHNTPPLQVVRGTLDALASPVNDMGINHRGFHVFMAEEFLDCPNVVAPFQKIRRKGMLKGVAGGTFGKVLLSTILALSANAACFNN